MTLLAYRGERYLDADEVEAWCAAIAAAVPGWVTLETIGTTVGGRPIQLLTIGDQAGDVADRPAVWLDGGTHAAEWTGIMAALYAVSSWVEALEAGDETLVAWFREHTAYVVPCICPDGFQHTRTGKGFVRSTLRPPRDGRPRVGLDLSDVDGDGKVALMRWRHAAGPWVFDDEDAPRMRHRRLDDDPDDCWMVTFEGRLLAWDGVRWTAASTEFGVDLNRNFPAGWRPFSMFGHDSGHYPLSEPESRAVVEAFAKRPRIGAVLTNHTYTGCLLTQPYHKPSVLPDADIAMMQGLARDVVTGTSYRVIKVHPDFMYDENKPIVGVWADAAATTFGVPAYTLELWDPYGAAGEVIDNPAGFFKEPDVAMVGRVVEHFAGQPDGVLPWTPVEHPELGAVDVGGLNYLTTVRNPPVALLAGECAQGFTVIDRLRRALPRLRVDVEVERLDDHTHRLRLVVENVGFLPTSGLRHAEALGTAPPITAMIDPRGCEVLEGAPHRDLGWLDGWGTLQHTSAAHPLYPTLPADRGPRAGATWLLRGQGSALITWEAGRAGRGSIVVSL